MKGRIGLIFANSYGILMMNISENLYSKAWSNNMINIKTQLFIKVSRQMDIGY